MKCSTLRKPMLSVCVPSVLVLLVVLAFVLVAMPTPVAAQAKDQRVIFGSAGFTESNRFWTVARPEHLQYDPFLETLLDVDPKTGEFIPRLAEKWEVSSDLKEWTFYLRKGVQFHYGFGEFTARDVVHSHSFMLRPDATSATAPLWREAEEVKVVNDYQVVFRLKRPMSIIPYVASRAGELRIVSKAQWDKEGMEGYEKRPAGTGSYRYVGRKTGISVEYERVDNHWSDKPDFKEIEIRITPEETTRFAMLMSGEAHIVDLPRELQKDALGRGMKIISSSQPVDWMSIYFGGQYYRPGDPKFQANVPWTNKKVRQALNMAVNRQEILATIFAGKGTLAYVSGWLPISEGWNPEWEKKFDQTYGYNPTRAKALLKEAGYPSWHEAQALSLHQSGRVGRARRWPMPWGFISKTWVLMRRSRLSTGLDYATCPETRTSSAASGPTLSHGGLWRSGSAAPIPIRGRGISLRTSLSTRPTSLSPRLSTPKSGSAWPGRLATISMKNSPTCRSSGSTMKWR